MRARNASIPCSRSIKATLIMRNRLSPEIRDKVLGMPEYSYGANKVRVTLRDGTQYADVLIAWAEEVIKVGSSTSIPFDAAAIVEVENDS